MEFEKDMDGSNKHLQTQENEGIIADEDILDFFLNVSKEDYERNTVVIQQLSEDVMNDMPYMTKALVNNKLFEGYSGEIITHYFSSGAFNFYFWVFIVVDLLLLAGAGISLSFLDFSMNFFSLWSALFGFSFICIMSLYGYVKSLKFNVKKRFNVSLNDFSSEGNSNILYLFSVLMNNQNYDRSTNKKDKLKLMKDILSYVKGRDTLTLEKLYQDLLAKNISFYLSKDYFTRKEKTLNIFSSLSKNEIVEAKEKILNSALSGIPLELSFNENSSKEIFDKNRFLLEGSGESNKSLLKMIDALDWKARENFKSVLMKIDRKTTIKQVNSEIFSFIFLAGFSLILVIVFLIASFLSLNQSGSGFTFFITLFCSLLFILVCRSVKNLASFKKKMSFKLLKDLSTNGEKFTSNAPIRDLLIVSLVLEMPSYSEVPLSEKEKFMEYAKRSLLNEYSTLQDVLTELDEKFILQRKYQSFDDASFNVNMKSAKMEELKRNFLFKS